MFARRQVPAAGTAAPSLARFRQATADHDLIAGRARLAQFLPNFLEDACALGLVHVADEQGAAALLNGIRDGNRRCRVEPPFEMLRVTIECLIRNDDAHDRAPHRWMDALSYWLQALHPPRRLIAC